MSEEIDIVSRVGGAILLAEVEWNPKTATVSKERAMALAAIEAMREPTGAMVEAGTASLHGYGVEYRTVDAYTAMIDAVLNP